MDKSSVVCDLYDCIVIGSGAMGLATQYQLSNRKMKTLCFEQFSFGHAKGSTHGQTRAIQFGYYDQPYYVPFLKRSYAEWQKLEELSGKKFLHQVGKLEVYHKDELDFAKINNFSKKYDLPLEIIIDQQKLKTKYPFFNFDEDHVGVTDNNSGYIEIDVAREAFVSQIDADICHRHVDEKVLDWQVVNGDVVVTTNKSSYKAKHLIITPGSWYEIVKYNVSGVNLKLKSFCWFDLDDDGQHVDFSTMPIFLFFENNKMFYGFRPHNNSIKLARHTGGGEIADPNRLDCTDNTAEVYDIIEFAQNRVNNVNMVPSGVKNCMYTQTIDSDFIIDRHPDYENVAFAMGFSGHGYKFAPAVGAALVDLAVTGSSFLGDHFQVERLAAESLV